jgi:hypothetical protein
MYPPTYTPHRPDAAAIKLCVIPIHTGVLRPLLLPLYGKSTQRLKKWEIMSDVGSPSSRARGSQYPHLTAELVDRGFNPLVLEMSEFQKMDGGLSCLSLRF